MKHPRILFVGSGKGSWQIRGKEMAAALSARAISSPAMEDMKRADVVVLVKRAIDQFGDMARESGLPVLWDCVDFWQQPEENQKPVAELVAQVKERQQRYGIRTLIGATRAMAQDIGGVYIPHHAKPGLVATPPRKRAKLVAYEGTPKYLGSWRQVLESACKARGLEFVINPRHLTDADALVALRGEQHDGEVCRRWKSGIKYVNALTAGRPVITQPSAGFEEINPEGVAIDRHELLGTALDAALQYRPEAERKAMFRLGDFSVEAVAAQYRSVIHTALREAA